MPKVQDRRSRAVIHAAYIVPYQLSQRNGQGSELFLELHRATQEPLLDAVARVRTSHRDIVSAGSSLRMTL